MWNLIHVNNQNVTKDTVIHDFQNNLIHCILECNHNLKIRKINDVTKHVMYQYAFHPLIFYLHL